MRASEVGQLAELPPFIPAKAGIQAWPSKDWVPAFAGTNGERADLIRENTMTPLNHFLGLVVGLAVAPQGRRPGAGIELVDAGRDLGVLALEQRIAGEVALHEERAEMLDVEHPHRLRQPELVAPVHARHVADAAAEQRAGAVADSGEIDRVVRHEHVAVDLRCHPALADNDVRAGNVEPAVEPFGEAERGGGGHRADFISAVRIDHRRRRAMEIGAAEIDIGCRHAGAFFDRALVDAFARRIEPPGEIDHGADLQRAQVFGGGRQLQLDGFQFCGHCAYSAASATGLPHSTVLRRL